MKYKIKKTGLKLLLIILLLSVLPIVNAGVSSPYWNDNPLIMAPGETKNVALILQNMVGDQDLVLKAELEEGSEIATLIDSNLEYLVPLGKKDIKVNLRISIPENTPIDTEYNIITSFREVKAEKAGMVHLGTRIDKAFPVIVKAPPQPILEEKPITITNTTLLIILIIIIVIGYFILKKKKEPLPFKR